SRPLSLTGGLGFFGGPGNSYVVHSIAEAVETCRRDPGSVGMVTGVGWYLTKHSVGLYSSSPPSGGFARVPESTTQADVDALPHREPAGPYDGEAVIEATTVVHDRDGLPALAITTALDRSGRRVLANSDDADVLAAMVSEVWEGRTVRITTDGMTNRLAV
ncbi:MAG TPA: acetyl-CoA acetyltransferase, partial [Acidimicrobiia bacterium]|nr:acetyl-CoA acetyltransferase [Acidimicrobiia bacterium]